MTNVNQPFYLQTRADFMPLNVKKHEIYSSKFVLSVVNLNHIELAAEEDHKYSNDHWARLFKARSLGGNKITSNTDNMQKMDLSHLRK